MADRTDHVSDAKAGEVICFTTGQYSDFHIVEFVLVLKDFNMEEQHQRHSEDRGNKLGVNWWWELKNDTRHGIGGEAGSDAEKDFVDFLIAENFLKKCEYREHYIEDISGREWDGKWYYSTIPVREGPLVGSGNAPFGMVCFNSFSVKIEKE